MEDSIGELRELINAARTVQRLATFEQTSLKGVDTVFEDLCQHIENYVEILWGEYLKDKDLEEEIRHNVMLSCLSLVGVDSFYYKLSEPISISFVMEIKRLLPEKGGYVSWGCLDIL